MDNWFYSQGNERHGPITLQELRELLASGRVGMKDLAWNESLPQWQEIQQITQLHPAIPPPLAATPTAAPINYYGSGMPPRATTILKGHAPPVGDVGTWPIDDAMFAEFLESVKMRKRISTAAQLYRALLFLIIIAGACIGIAGFIGVMTSGGRNTGFAIGLLIGTVVLAGFAAFYWVLWRFTLRSYRWAPLTFFIVCLAGVGINLITILFGSSRPNPVGAEISAFIGILFAIGFAVTSWRAFAAIPKYLAQPAWCQELIAAAKL
jgi:hypothetical protein